MCISKVANTSLSKEMLHRWTMALPEAIGFKIKISVMVSSTIGSYTLHRGYWTEINQARTELEIIVHSARNLVLADKGEKSQWPYAAVVLVLCDTDLPLQELHTCAIGGISILAMAIIF